jgi:hypothetical protein
MLYGHVHDTWDQRLMEQAQALTPAAGPHAQGRHAVQAALSDDQLLLHVFRLHAAVTGRVDRSRQKTAANAL